MMAARGDRPVILLRTGWQLINIGDVCFTPAMLGMLDKSLPEAEVIVWPAQWSDGVERMVRRRWPDVQVVRGHLGRGDAPLSPQVAEAYSRASLYLYNSGPILSHKGGEPGWNRSIGPALPLIYARDRGVPYGCYAESFEGFEPPADIVFRELLSAAAFVYCRDTRSLAHLREIGLRTPALDFAPDVAFGFDLTDDDRAVPFLRGAGLEDGRFLTAIVHYSVTHRPGVVEHAETMLDAMRHVITRWVRETGLPVLLCPEDEREIEVHRDLLVPPLPDDVKKLIRQRETFWLPDEALSVVKRSRAMFSMEPHTMIWALAHGVPCLHPMVWEFGRKAEMWRDIGLGEWVFHFLDTEAETMADRLLEVHHDHDAARAKVAEAMTFVRARMDQAFAVVRGAAVKGHQSRWS